MSLSVEPVKVAKVVDQRVNFPDWAMPVREGGANVSYLRTVATSKAPGAIQFDLTPPNPSSSVVGRDMLMYNKVTFTITAAAGAETGNLIQPGVNDAPRAFPISSCIDTATIQINNESITLNNWGQIGHVLRRFNPRSAMYKLSNFCPWFPDQGDYEQLQGSNRSVVSAASAGDYDFMRGAYTRFRVIATTATQATVELITMEPVNMSPFLYGSQSPGIPYVQNMSLRFNISDFKNALSHAKVATNRNIASVTAVHDECVLYYQSITVPQLESTLRPFITLPHYRLLTNFSREQELAATPTGTLPDGSRKQTFTSDVLNYSSIPSRIYVFVAPTNGSRDPECPDHCARYVDGLSVQWNGKTALMTSVQREQLYTSAVDSGLALPWEQFDGAYRFASADLAAANFVAGVGSVLCLRPGVDWELEPGMTPGCAGSFQLQIQANFENQMPTARRYQLFVVAVNQGTLTLTSGYECKQDFGVISTEDVLNATERIHPKDHIDTFGSGWWDTLSSMVRTGLRGAHKVASIASAAEPILSAAKGFAGAGVKSGGSALSGAGAADFYGGAMLGKKKLADRLR